MYVLYGKADSGRLKVHTEHLKVGSGMYSGSPLLGRGLVPHGYEEGRKWVGK